MDLQEFEAARDESKDRAGGKTKRMISELREGPSRPVSVTQLGSATGLSPRTIRLALRQPVKDGWLEQKKIDGDWWYCRNAGNVILQDAPAPKTEKPQEGEKNAVVQDDSPPDSPGER